MPSDLPALVRRSIAGTPAQPGIFSRKELADLLRRLAGREVDAVAAAAITTVFREALSAGTLALDPARRATIDAWFEAAHAAGLSPAGLRPPDEGQDWVDRLSAPPVVSFDTPPASTALPDPINPALIVRDGDLWWGDHPVTPGDITSILLALPQPASAELRSAVVRSLRRKTTGLLVDADLLAAAALLPPGPPTTPEPADGPVRAAAWRVLSGVHPTGDDAGYFVAARLIAEQPWPSPDPRPALLGALARAARPAAADALLASLPGFRDLLSAPQPEEVSRALVAALHAWLGDAGASPLTFGSWSAASEIARSDLTHTRAVRRWSGPDGSLSASPPSLDGVPLTPTAVSALRPLIAAVRDEAAARHLVRAVDRARQLTPGPADRPLRGTGLHLLLRAARPLLDAAELHADSRSDFAALPEAVVAASATLGPQLTAWHAGLAATPPVARVGADTLAVPPSLAPWLRDLASDRVASDRSLPNLLATLRVFATQDLDDAAADSARAFLDGYLAAWPGRGVFDFNKLQRLARAHREGTTAPVFRVNGEPVPPGDLHTAVGEVVKKALSAVAFPQAWMAHRFGYRAKQAAELVDLLAERAAEGKGPLATLAHTHPDALITVTATTSDMEYNALVYRARTPQEARLYYLNSSGDLVPHGRAPEPKHVLFEASVTPEGHLDVQVPSSLPLSPRAYPLMNTWGTGDRIDVEVHAATASEAQVEKQRFETRYTVRLGTILGFDTLGNHRVRVELPDGPVEHTFTVEQIRAWNSPHLVPEEAGEACTVSFSRARDARFAADLTEMTSLAHRHELPFFPLAWSEEELSAAQKRFLKALNTFTSSNLRYPRTPPADDQDRTYHERLASGTHPMGEYLAAQRGVCRHQFVREHMGKQRAGIDERFASGAANTYSGEFRGLHIWGEVQLADRSRLLYDNPEPADPRFLSDATWADPYVPLWTGAYGNDLRRIEMYDRTRVYARMITRADG